MIELKPSEIRYSQGSIKNVFGLKSDHPNVYIGETLDRLIEGLVNVSDIPKISVQMIGTDCVSADNRRLWVFKQLEKFGKCKTIPVNVVRYIPKCKQTSTNDGISVKIRGGDPGGSYFSLLPLVEKLLKDKDSELDEYRMKIVEVENKLQSLNAMCLQFKTENTKLHQANEFVKTESEKLINLNSLKDDDIKKLETKNRIMLKESTEYFLQCSKVTRENEEQGCKIVCLTGELRNAQAQLSKSNEIHLQSKENYEYLIRNLRTKIKILENKIKELEKQLSTLHRHEQTQAYKNVEAAYEDRLQVLQFDTERLQRSQQRAWTCYFDTEKKVVQIKTENDKLKQESALKDKRMMELKKMYMSMYDLIQNF